MQTKTGSEQIIGPSLVPAWFQPDPSLARATRSFQDVDSGVAPSEHDASQNTLRPKVALDIREPFGDFIFIRPSKCKMFIHVFVFNSIVLLISKYNKNKHFNYENRGVQLTHKMIQIQGFACSSFIDFQLRYFEYRLKLRIDQEGVSCYSIVHKQEVLRRQLTRFDRQTNDQ